MMQRTAIEYLNYTWNPLAMRCTPVSAGCAHCWHLRMCDRHAGNPKLPDAVRAAKRGDGPPVLLDDELDAPRRLRKPARIGCQFMGDLFHEDIPYGHVAAVIAAMVVQTQHTFVVLTKRAERMCEIMTGWIDHMRAGSHRPLENLWLGVSIEDQRTADERIPHLLRCPAAMRWVSIEPVLGALSIMDRWLYPLVEGAMGEPERVVRPRLDWVVVGGETGPGARPAKLAWFYSIRDQCRAAGVPLFVKTLGTALEKQMGVARGWLPDDLSIREYPKGADDD